MRKIITLSQEKLELAQELMKETLTDSLSQLFSALMLSYQQNKKRPPGRPRTKEEESEEDTTTLYKAADWPDNRNGYTLDELREWYAYDHRRGPMPPVEELERHPDSPTKG